MTEHDGRAVVVGAGMAGLLAARALSERYEQVTVVDRDEISSTAGGPATPRRGVPQGRHAHALLSRGQQELEAMLPGLRSDLLAGGAAEGDAMADFRLFLGGRRLPRAHSGMRMISSSRAHLEARVRDRVLDHPRVCLRGGCDAAGLVGDQAQARGLRLLDRTPGSPGRGAGGRPGGGRLGTWFSAAGLAAIPSASGSARRSGWTWRCTSQAAGSASTRRSWTATSGSSAAPARRCPERPPCARLETGEWLLTAGGFLGPDRPPLDLADVLGFVRPLPVRPRARTSLGAGRAGHRAGAVPVPVRDPSALPPRTTGRAAGAG